ncbi:Melibiose operon regulatory protein [compost metagenome]
MKILGYISLRLLSESFEKCSFGKENVLVFMTDCPVIIRLGAKEYNLKSDQLAVFNSVKLVNDFEQEVNLKGILVQTDEPIRCSKIYDKEKNEPLFLAFLERISGMVSTDRFINCLEDLLLQDNVSPSPIKPFQIDTRLIKVNRFIRNNYHQPITLNILAELVETNPVYLCNSYSRVFKIPPMNHLLKLRLEKAKEYLSSSDISVKEISYKIGYVSNSQFSAYFKKMVGVTPIEYRRSLQYMSDDWWQE